MKKSLFLFFFSLTIYYHATGQIPQRSVTVQSPNAATLGLFGEYPVSYYTGVHDIQIPLYTLKEKEISVPVSLSYHASGVRPDQHPGWVGNGWALNAGGVITRTVNDVYDEFNSAEQDVLFAHNTGFYYTHNNLNTIDWSTSSSISNGLTNVVTTPDIYIRDTEPDEFSFNFLGYNGKFYMDSNGNWKVKCDKPVKITLLNVTTDNVITPFLDIPFAPPRSTTFYTVGYPKSFAGFIITAEDGTQYQFGGTTDAIEYGIPFYSQNNLPWIASSWYLTKIISKNSYETVNFTYEKDSFINQMYISVLNNLGTSTHTLIGTGFMGWVSGDCENSSFTTLQNSYFGQLIAPVYLKEIKTDNFSMTFNRDQTNELRYTIDKYDTRNSIPKSMGQDVAPILETDHSTTGNNTIPPPSGGGHVQLNFEQELNFLQWKQLNSIAIKKNGVQMKWFSFVYTNDPTKRLSLTSISENDNGDESIKLYDFDYYDPSYLPGYLSNMTDHFGFYNGVFANVGSADYLQTYYDKRVPSNNLNYVQAGTLRKIHFPTGGTTEFVYELNQFRKRVKDVRANCCDIFTTDQLAGGLRIKKIISSPNADPASKITKEYFYVSGYSPQANIDTLSSSGILGNKIQYYFGDYEARAAPNTNGNISFTRSLFSSQPLFPGSDNSTGSHIGYSEVVEKRTDGSYSKFLFSNYDNPLYSDEPAITIDYKRTPYTPVNSNGAERGVLLHSEMRNANNKPVKTEDYQYTALNKSSEFVWAVRARSFGGCGIININAIEATAYKFYTYSYLPSVITTTNYDPDGLNPTTIAQNNYYDNPSHRQLTRSVSTNSKAETLTTVNLYPPDYGVSASSDFLTAMIAANNIGAPIETVTYKQFPDGTKKIISGFINEYRPANGDYISKMYALETIQPLDVAAFRFSNQSQANSLPFQTSGNPVAYYRDNNIYKEKLSYLYDESKITQAKFKETQTNTYIWGYNNSFPIAEVNNASTANNVAYTSFESNYDDLKSGAGQARWLYPTEGITSGEAKTGSKYYALTGRQINSNLAATGNILISYWASAPMAVKNNVSGLSYPATVTGKTIKGWTYYKHAVNLPGGTTGTISLSGTGNIDELRMYPANATMKTYTYTPMVGMTSSTDEKGISTYYNYDSFLRLLNIKDQNRNILKSYDYHYAVIGNIAKTATFIKTCTNGLPGPPISYTVEANTFFGNSQEQADALALQDLNIKGQAKAESEGSCGLPFVQASITAGYIGSLNYYYNDWTVTAFTDATCTTPYTVPANLTINYTTESSKTVNGVLTTTSVPHTVTIMAGSNSQVITVVANTCGNTSGSNTVSSADKARAQQQSSTSGGATTNGNTPPPGSNCTTSYILIKTGSGYNLPGSNQTNQ